MTARTSFKPFDYPWAFEYYQDSEAMHWLAKEVKLHDDVKQWKQVLTDQEKNLLTQLFRFFTQADCDVSSGYVERYLPRFSKPELRLMLLSFANREAVHIEAYSQLIETLGLPESEYSAFTEYEAMSEKHEYMMASNDGSLRSLAKDMAIFSAFGEGLQLFSSFAVLFSFSLRGLMPGMTEIVKWSIKDESLHVSGMIKLFTQLMHENPELWDDAFKRELYQVRRDMVDLEDKFIDLMFEMGDLPNISAEETKKFIRYLADHRGNQLGIKPEYNIPENPFPWVDEMMALTHANFFERRSTEYAKGQLEGETSSDDFM